MGLLIGVACWYESVTNLSIVCQQPIRLGILVVLLCLLLLIGRDCCPSVAEADHDVSGKGPCSWLTVCLSGNDRDGVSVCIGG